MTEKLKFKTTDVYYTAHCLAENPASGNDFPFDMSAGWSYGMHHKEPGWEPGGGGEHYRSPETALELAQVLPQTGYQFRILPDSIRVMRHRVETEHYVEDVE